MLFLIEYDRLQGQIISFRSFASSEVTMAQEARLALELTLNQKGVHREVVVLEALDEETLRRSHRRYFENLKGLAEPPG